MDAFNKYLEQYESLKRNIDDISSILRFVDDISSLNVTDVITGLVNIFNDEMLSIDLYGLSDEQVKSINEKNDEIKELFVKLKNQQIYAYNLIVWEVNNKIETIRKTCLDLKIEDRTQGLNTLKWSNVYLTGDWKRNNYKKSLDYDRLAETYNKVSELEKSMGIQKDEPLDLKLRISFCEQNLIDMREQVKDDMSLVDINTLLDRYMFMYDNVLELEIKVRQQITMDVYKDDVKKISSMLRKVRETLLEKKDKVDEKNNQFTSIKNMLVILNKESVVLQNKVFQYYGECNKDILNRFKAHLKMLEKKLEKIEGLKSNAVLESSQSSKLDSDIANIKDSFNKLDSKLKNPYILGKNLNSYVLDKISELSKEMEAYKNEVEQLESPLRDGEKRKEINSFINEKRADIEWLEILKSKGMYFPLGGELDTIKENFDGICKEYNSRCPLFVKKVKSSDKLYKKYNKQCLEISGLSSVSLLERSPLIPAIMHGNIVIGSKVPFLKKFVNSINNILGGMINARRDDKGEWYLSNGFKIDSSVAETSLFQNLAVSNITSLPLVRNVVSSIKKIGLKMSAANKKRKEKFEKFKEEQLNKINHKKSKRR